MPSQPPAHSAFARPRGSNIGPRDFAGEIAEAALAHAIGDRVEAAYRRGDWFEQRRRLMEAWGSYCTTPV